MKVASVGSIVFASILAGAQAFAADAPVATLRWRQGGCGCRPRRRSAARATAPPAAARTRSGRTSPARAPPTSPSSCTSSRTNVRVNPVMKPILDTVPEADFKDLAVYFATQTPSGLEADPSYWKAGEKLYRKGDPARNIPACARLPRPARSRQSGRRLPGAACPALRLHGQAAERLRQGHALPRRDRTEAGHAERRHHGDDREAAHGGRHPGCGFLRAGNALIPPIPWKTRPRCFDCRLRLLSA